MDNNLDLDLLQNLSLIRLVSAFPLGMMSCRDDLDDGALALAGSRDDHWARLPPTISRFSASRRRS